MRLIDDLFGMGGGYVLDFSDRTFAAFFSEELSINIDEPRYAGEGTSKAKRLRYFLKTCDPAIRVRTLLALWEYREANRRRNRTEEPIPGAEAEFSALIERLGGNRSPKPATPATAAPASNKIELALAHALRDKLLEVSRLDPQSRGFAYEKFLKDVFSANGLAPRASFRVVGSKSTAVSSCLARHICWRRSGKVFQSALRICTPFTVRSKTKPLGREGFS